MVNLAFNETMVLEIQIMSSEASLTWQSRSLFEIRVAQATNGQKNGSAEESRYHHFYLVALNIIFHITKMATVVNRTQKFRYLAFLLWHAKTICLERIFQSNQCCSMLLTILNRYLSYFKMYKAFTELKIKIYY